MKIKDLCEMERPREKLIERGAAALTDAELLAILIGSGTRKENVLEIANRMLSEMGGSLSSLSSMSREEMMRSKGIGRGNYSRIAAALELGKRAWINVPKSDKIILRGAKNVWELLSGNLRGLDHEQLWVIYLNRSNRVLGIEMASKGGSSSTVVDPKLIVREALDKKACGLILAHNHPSGNPRPGERDIVETDNIRRAARTFDIALLDHVIVCDESYFSFAEDREFRIV